MNVRQLLNLYCSANTTIIQFQWKSINCYISNRTEPTLVLRPSVEMPKIETLLELCELFELYEKVQ